MRSLPSSIRRIPPRACPRCWTIRTLAAVLPADPRRGRKAPQLDRILQDCLGLAVETTIAQAEVVPGEA